MQGQIVDRALPLRGVYNCRDMGGFVTHDGRIVKKGLLFRSADLTDLTNGDLAYLQPLDIKWIYDYRDRREAEERPDPPIGRARHERVAVNGEDKTTAKSEWTPAAFYKTFSKQQFMHVYKDMPIHNPSYQRLMEFLKQPEEHLPLLHHCAGGRDRTGIGAMLILKLLDVPDDQIMTDYLLSNSLLKAFHQATFEEAAQYISGARLQQFEKDFLVQEDYLNAAMAAIRESYGSFDMYLEQEFSIDTAKREAIMDFCLE
ncbi:MAG: tyrosine-protein phosphatase [Sporolactobacillus sp.]